MGPHLRFTAPAAVAVTGATMPVTVGGQTRPQWESLDVAAGDLLEFGILQQGARIYIAVAGGIDAPAVLGSRPTYALGAFGGFAGRAVQADRKSTRLNSSHANISYAVFCLKKTNNPVC